MGDLTWCKGSTMSSHGEVKVSWKIENGMFKLDIDIPNEGFADVYLPSGKAESVGEGHHHFEEVTPPTQRLTAPSTKRGKTVKRKK